MTDTPHSCAFCTNTKNLVIWEKAANGFPDQLICPKCEDAALEESVEAASNAWDATEDMKNLTAAADFFENLATGENPLPLVFARAIRRALSELGFSAEAEAALADDGPATDEESAAINSSWVRFKALFPVAKVINNNQPGQQAIIEILSDPPTLPVGTFLFTSLQGAKDNAIALEVFTGARS